MPADPAYYTVAEVQARLRLRKPDPVLAAIHAGQLRAVNVSAGPTRPTWRISEQALSAWLESRTARPAVAAPRQKRARVPGGVTPYF